MKIKHQQKSRKKDQDEGDVWLSLSDLAFGGFIIFFIISVAFMSQYKIVQSDEDAKKKLETEIAKLKRDTSELRKDIDSLSTLVNRVTEDRGMFEPLKNFDNNMVEVLDKEGIIRFRTINNKELFASGSNEMSPVFDAALVDFLDNFFEVLTDTKGGINRIDRIAEIRVEGHTDTECISSTIEDNCYMDNLILSQERARRVLQRMTTHKVFNETFKTEQERIKIRNLMTATGYSYSKVLKADGSYATQKQDSDKTRSRRVELRVFLKTK